MHEPSASGADEAEQTAERGRWRGRSVEIGAGLVLACGAVAGLLLWAEWGFLIAFDAVVTYCFG